MDGFREREAVAPDHEGFFHVCFGFVEAPLDERARSPREIRQPAMIGLAGGCGEPFLDLCFAIRARDVADLEMMTGLPEVSFGREPRVSDLLGETNLLLEPGEILVAVVRTASRPHRRVQHVGQCGLVTDPPGHLDGAASERRIAVRTSHEDPQSGEPAHDLRAEGAVPVLEGPEGSFEDSHLNGVSGHDIESRAEACAPERGAREHLRISEALGEVGGLLQALHRLESHAPARLAVLDQELTAQPLIRLLPELECLEPPLVVDRCVLVRELLVRSVAGPGCVPDGPVHVAAREPLEEVMRQLREMGLGVPGVERLQHLRHAVVAPDAIQCS